MDSGPSDQDSAAPSHQPCPHCHRILPIHPGYVTWCDQCEWNITPLDRPLPQNTSESFNTRMWQRWSKRSFKQLIQAHSLQPTLTLSTLLGFAIAACVHGLTLAVLVVGAILVVQGWPSCVAVGIGGLSLAIAWTLRPTFPQLDKDEQEKVVARATCPTLYTLVDRVAHALNTSPVETIIVDGDFNARFRRVGWRRRRVLFLGLPYLTILDRQEYVALISHELAHGVNGDPNHGLVVGSAIGSLIRWYNLFYPRHLSEAEHPIEILALPLKAVLLLVALMIQSVLNDLVRLNWHNAQRAEYLADALGAQVAGTEASLSLLSKVHYNHTFYLTLKQMSLRDTPGDLFAAVWRQVAQVPPRELERIQRVEQKHKAGGNGTHPPTVYRRDMLLAHPQPTPQVTLAPAEFVRLQGELAALQPRIQAELLDAHRRSLYY